MMRRNHEFCSSVALSPGFRNWVEMTRNMQQEGVGLVLLPRPASLVHSPVLTCVEAPLGESVVLLADTGGEKPTGAAVLLCVCVRVCVCLGGCACVCVCMSAAGLGSGSLRAHVCVCLAHVEDRLHGFVQVALSNLEAGMAAEGTRGGRESGGNCACAGDW